MTDILLTEEDRMLQRTVADLADKEIEPRAAEIDESEEFPWENIKALASLGLMGMTIDPEYGGGGAGYKQLAIAIEEIARACAATSVSHIAHLSLASATIDRFGTEGQKRRFLPSLTAGEKLAAWCLSEPSSGSDAAGIQTTATRQNGGYILNGSKNFITNGSIADTLVVFATTDRSQRAKGVIALVVERDTKGVDAQPMHGKMGMRASDTAQIFFDNVAVPEENRLGEEDEGFKAAMLILDSSRISIAAQSVGIARAAYEAAVAYARERKTFGKPIAEHQAIQFMIADMATRIDAARLLTLRAAVLKDNGEPYIQASSEAKLFASETATFCADRAVQVHGGYGYFKPTVVERVFRDSRVLEIYEGTSEVQRLVIARQVLAQLGG
jgi:alkylation response protein AidB-like acyl-CoA dehydrogenase